MTEPVWLPRPGGQRRSSSKYDFVKVRVWLDNHYYILSRFLLSRVLTTVQVTPARAIEISLELKKNLVDEGVVDLTQTDFEERLFAVMRSHDYADDYVRRYDMMSRFHNHRVPLVIFIMGTACVGKSTVATRLATRLNLPNVLQTDVVYEMMCSVVRRLAEDPIWYRTFEEPKDFLEEYERECRIVQEGLRVDISKAFRDGKSIIIEGFHIDPALYFELAASHDAMFFVNSDLERKDVEGNGSDDDRRRAGIHGNGLVIPFVLRLNERDHRLFIEQWLTSHADRLPQLGSSIEAQTAHLMRSFRLIQDHLCAVQGINIVDINADDLEDTVTQMHTTVLERIETAFPLLGLWS